MTLLGKNKLKLRKLCLLIWHKSTLNNNQKKSFFFFKKNTLYVINSLSIDLLLGKLRINIQYTSTIAIKFLEKHNCLVQMHHYNFLDTHTL